MGQVIRTEDLCFKNFIKYPNIHIEEKTVTFISGISGCGKSVLLKLLNGTISPSNGRVFYQGQDISTLHKISLRRDVLLVKQVPYLAKGSIHQNFIAFHQIHESDCPSEVAIRAYLNLCSVPHSLETQCDTMSGGERQRVFLSIALSLLPKVLLLDEPTSALDKELSKEVLSKLIAYAKQQSISLIIISHDMELQATFAKHTIGLRNTK